MAFENTELPATILLGSQIGPMWDVEVVEYGQGSRYVNRRLNHSRYRFGLRHIMDRDNLYAQITDFFEALGGPAVGFLVDNPIDNSTNMGSTATAFDMTLGTGDGATTTFNLNKTYTVGSSTVTRRIHKPKSGTILVGDNSSPQATYTVVYDTTPGASEVNIDTDEGTATFGTAPSSSTPLTWGGGFYIPVALETNDLSGILHPDRWSEVGLDLIELMNP